MAVRVLFERHFATIAGRGATGKVRLMVSDGIIDGDTYKAIGKIIERNAEEFWDWAREEGGVDRCIILGWCERTRIPGGLVAFDFDFKMLLRKDIPEHLIESVGEANLKPAKPGALRVVVYGDSFRAGVDLFPAMFGVSRGGDA